MVPHVIVPQDIFVFFHPYRTAFPAFCETDFWILYSVTLYCSLVDIVF